MRLLSLELQNYRGFRNLHLDVSRDITVLVGINGSGKSSVLDAIASSVGAMYGYAFDVSLPELEGPGLKARDLRQGAPRLSIKLDIEHIRRQAEIRVDSSSDQPDFETWVSENIGMATADLNRCPPLCVYRSVRNVRQVQRFAGRVPKTMSRVAFNALRSSLSGDFDLRQVSRLLRTYAEMSAEERETKIARRFHLVADACTLLLGTDYNRARSSSGKESIVLRKKRKPLRFEQLSAGEKSLMTMGADIARRLWWANPNLENPLHGEAVVLLDEPETHLHPSWQAEILPRLTTVFPQCQFIVATHSPHVLASVATNCVLVLDDFRLHAPGAPTRGRRADTIVEDVLGAQARPSDVRASLAEIELAVDQGELKSARRKLTKLETAFGADDPDFVRISTMLTAMGA